MYFRNLWKAFLAIFGSKDFRQLLLNIDRLGNAFCAGYYKFTVSARIGYFAKYRTNDYWLLLQWVVNSTFYPIDGKNHCLMAYAWEKGYIKLNEDKDYRRGNDIALAMLSVVVFASCLILAPVIWLISLIEKGPELV